MLLSHAEAERMKICR